MKSYVYNKSHFFIQHTVPGIFTVLIGLYCLIRTVITGPNALMIFVLIICIYNVWNEFVSLSNPSQIDIDEDLLTFRVYKSYHTYKINEIQNFSMRMTAGNTSIYMNINKGGLLKGRYWVRVSEFEDEKELVEYFYDLDEKINPDSMFTKARKEGRKRLAQKELIKQRKQEIFDAERERRREVRKAKKEKKKLAE